MKARPNIDALFGTFDVDFDAGTLRWKNTINSRARRGSRAGTLNGAGYRQVALNGTLLLEHRVIWAMLHKKWPTKELDHIDSNRSNNSVSNLRLATRSQNACNGRPHKNNSSGVKGVHWSAARKTWNAQITLHGKGIHIGVFNTLADATIAVRKARRQIHGEFTNHG